MEIKGYPKIRLSALSRPPTIVPGAKVTMDGVEIGQVVSLDDVGIVTLYIPDSEAAALLRGGNHLLSMKDEQTAEVRPRSR